MIQAVIYVEVFKIISLLNKRTLADRRPPATTSTPHGKCLSATICLFCTISLSHFLKLFQFIIIGVIIPFSMYLYYRFLINKKYNYIRI